MKRALKLAVLAASFTFCIPSFASAYDFSDLETHLAANENVWFSLGAPRVYLEVRRHGETIHTFSRGDVGANRKLPIASATKWVSGAAMLALAETGEFDLDQPISTVLPAYNRPVKALITPMHAFTIRDGLVTGVSGIPMYSLSDEHDLQESAQLIAEEALMGFLPGNQLGYGGSGMQAAGAMMEVVFEDTWENLAAQTVFSPVGMTNSSYTHFAPNPAIGGGMESTANDYLAFLEMLLGQGRAADGTQVLTQESIEIMFQNYTAGLPTFYTPWGDELDLPGDLERIDYAFGTWVLREDANGRVQKALSPGAFGTAPFLDRELGTYGIVMTALADAKPTWPVVLRALELIEEAVLEHDATQPSTWMIY
ncbi:MAG: beta-lactamase family protein [Candidatus Sumerlaeia bacterium]|nr:beta-lactamase family protein [Candidatus Sumerlaeia bacterium]